MKQFNEFALVAALCSREEDAREIKEVFDPEWLTKAELKPVLKAIYDYMDSQATTPSIESLAQYMEAKDKAKFDERWNTTLQQLKGVDPKLMRFNVDLAKETAAAASLQHLIQEHRFQKMMEEGHADGLKAEVSKWLSKHADTVGEELVSIQEAIEKVVDDHPWQGRQPKAATGIKPIDEWSGGLRPPQLGILLAPTGHGKSALLMNIAWYAAAIEGLSVLFVTNELTINEQTERFLVRMQDPKPDASGNLSFVTLDKIQDDPSTAYKKLEGYQKGLDERLYIYSANLGQNVTQLDDVLQRVRLERGKWPDLLVIDYMERMSPKVRMDRGQTWTYYGQVAKELVWLAKRRKCAIWTAAQTNRGGMSTKVEMSMEYAQGSIQHFQEAALAYGVRRVTVTLGPEEQAIGLEFTELKSRHGAMEGRKMIVRADLSRMFVSQEEIENIQEVEDADAAEANTGPKKAIKGQAQVKGKK